MTVKVVSMPATELADLIKNAIHEATVPLNTELRELREKVESRKDFYSVAELAERSGFGKTMVYDWINKGRVLPDGKRVYLKTVDGLTEGSTRIRHEAWMKFLSHFPDVSL